MAVKVSRMFTVELPDGESFDVEVSANSEKFLFGEDGDGRKGEWRESLEDIEVSDAEMKRLKEAIQKAVKNCDWEDR